MVIERKCVYFTQLWSLKKNIPKSFEKKMEEKPKDARALGSNLAKESLDKIRTRLAK